MSTVSSTALTLGKLIAAIACDSAAHGLGLPLLPLLTETKQGQTDARTHTHTHSLSLSLSD